MNVLDGLERMTSPLSGSAVAIGVFDGVHLGHQEILHKVVEEAAAENLTAIALTFDIHPSALFAPATAPSYLGSLAQRLEMIERYGGGIETVVVAHFTREFAGLSPEAFASEILAGHLGARHILVGSDFCYGRGRTGTTATLRDSGRKLGFAITVVPPFLRDGRRVSSTDIRQTVNAGRLPEATALLGHPFVVQGRVVPGKRLGRTLGFPTANAEPVQENQLLPGNGIYAAYVHLSDGRCIPAAVSVGINPTTDADGERKVEAHLLDFEANLYNEIIGIQFHVKLRDEHRYEHLEDLQTQIAFDVAQVRRILPVSL